MIYFTSDRGGKPQVYRVAAGGGTAERITLEGENNARASMAPDGRSIAVAHGRGNEYRIGVWDLETERMRILTPGVLDESPSFAPNGSMILYATREGDRGVLSAVSSDGNVRQRLILSEGDVREPAWSPVIR
jgi:TolB protein